MKKLVFAVAAALMVSFAVSSCGGNSEGDEAVKAYKELVEQVEKAQKDGDVAAALEIIKKAGELEEKYKDVKLTDAQAKEIEELMKKLK